MSDLNLFQDVDECVEDALRTVGNEVIVGLPIAVGKPTHIANTLYRKAQQNSNIRLTLCSGLTLQTPKWKSDLERRFFEPLVGRLFPDYPDPAYLVDAHRKALPPNVMLKEFYFSPGLSLHNCHLQANYISTNYTHVARDISAMGANVTAVMMGKGSGRNEGMYNLGATPTPPSCRSGACSRKRRRGGRSPSSARSTKTCPTCMAEPRCRRNISRASWTIRSTTTSFSPRPKSR